MAGQADTKPTPTTPRQQMLAALRDSIAEEVTALLVDRWDEVTAAMDAQTVAEAMENRETDEPCKFRVGLSVQIVSTGTEATHEVQLRWGVRHSARSESKRVAADDPRRPRLPGVGGVSK